MQPATFYPVLTCNARCPFCSTRVYTDRGVVSAEDYLRSGPLRNGPMRLVQEYTFSLEQAKQEYRKLLDQGIDSIHLQGGEPTVYEPLAELIAYGKEIGIREQVLVTNGRMFKDAAYARKIAESGISTIALSLFGATAAVHDESLGVDGSFADMVAGAQHLAALRDESEGRLQLTGQIILHARNFRHLPEMLSFWYGVGIRYFGFRLLRDSANTLKQLGRGGWFFDLADLRPFLEEALDRAAVLPDVEISFSEIFYCLLSEDFLGFVLGDMQTSERLFAESVLASRHGTETGSYAASRNIATEGAGDPCKACEVERSCMKVESVYKPHFKGSRSPIDVRERFAQVTSKPISDDVRYLRLRRLLFCDRAMSTFGIPEEERLDLFARLIAHASGRGGLPSPLAVSARSQRRILDIREEWKKRAIRFVKLSELAPSMLFEGEGDALLDRLVDGAADDKKKALAFLKTTQCLLVESLFVVYAGRLDRGSRLPSIPFLAVLYNDACVDEAMIAGLLGPGSPEGAEN